jgi:hypothetical protein
MSRFAQLPVRREIELLATIDGPTSKMGQSGHGFGTIVELGPHSLVLEANREFSPGDELTVKAIFPGQRRGEDPFAYLRGVVRKVQDRASLQFDVALGELTLATRRRLTTYLEEAAGPLLQEQ